MTTFILLSVFAYLLGSVTFAHVVAKVKKIDLTKIGSKSATSTNLARAIGWKWGALTAVLDFLKGVIPAFLALRYLTIEWQIVIVAVLPTLGHIFPIFFQFKGGKGGATFLGTCCSLVGIKYFIPAFLVWILILVLTKITGLTNFIFPWLFSVFLYFNFPFFYFIIGILEATLLTFALRNNLRRLVKGIEPKSPSNL